MRCRCILLIETEKQDKKEKMDTRRNKEGWDTRKLYEVMLMKEIPGIHNYKAKTLQTRQLIT